MRKMRTWILAALMLVQIPAILQAGEIKGYMIPEYYSVFSNHKKDVEDNHGFWLRRIYFTYNNDITDNVKMRLRLEMNSPGDFSTSSTLTPAVKDAYFSFKLGGQSFKVGIQAPPTFNQIEAIWGHRPLEKTPMDLLKLRSSRDFGVSMSGSLDSGKTVTYSLMYGNGSSNKAEIDQGKVVYAALGFAPSEGVYLEAYGDYESQPDEEAYFVYQGFASYSGEFGRFGIQYSNKRYDNGETGVDFSVVSGFAVIRGGEKLELIGRYDKTFGDGWEEGFKGNKISYIPFADNVKSNFALAAVSYQVVKNVWVIPNIKAVFYDKPGLGEKPEADMYGNLTIYFKF